MVKFDVSSFCPTIVLCITWWFLLCYYFLIKHSESSTSGKLFAMPFCHVLIFIESDFDLLIGCAGVLATRDDWFFPCKEAVQWL